MRSYALNVVVRPPPPPPGRASLRTAGFPVVRLGFVGQHAPPTVGFPVFGLGIVRQQLCR
ncbi:hypothetical protein KSP39_PZI016525 [Platanthera zijinensis]|uniref:Uncharacterized protein n=1 Tax=Platanthera zijinensis TaxID=2320716 RepID=A0AAP0B6Y4_9ASPA